MYVVTTDAKGAVKTKHEVTQQVINAVMKHMDVTKEEYECEVGELIFRPKGSDSTAQAQAEEGSI